MVGDEEDRFSTLGPGTEMTMTKDSTKNLIIGAGPYGLSLSAFCEREGIDHMLAGEPMEFWKNQMPGKMLLRSTLDWHLDPFEKNTLRTYFFDVHGEEHDRPGPIALDNYLEYCRWFVKEAGIKPVSKRVASLSRSRDGAGRFVAAFNDGSKLLAERVVVTAGFGACKHVPQDYADTFPQHLLSHTQDIPDLDRLKRKSVLIIGGRQSAFEWAALAAESGAAAVHVCYRHASPSFAQADWSWVDALLDLSERCPGWYRKLSDDRKKSIARQMWDIGRGTLEPWLAARINRPEVTLWPQSRVAAAEIQDRQAAVVSLDNGHKIHADHVVLATGYKTDVRRLGFLERGGIFDDLSVTDGYPDLNEVFESNIPGLFFTNRFATRDFGGFFDFTAGCRASARMIGAAILSLERA
jgi:cation diffusion facilitator CzcD-associated flavoprotein CzcO